MPGFRPAIALSREGLARVRVRPRRGCTRSVSEVARSRLRGLPHANLRGLPHATQSHPRFFTTASLSRSEIAHTRRSEYGTAAAAAAAAAAVAVAAAAAAAQQQ